jgi:protein-S-isoprenylcysteine O-methyltransferase Ste14
MPGRTGGEESAPHMANRSTAEIVRLTLLYAFVGTLIAFSDPRPWTVVSGGVLVVLGEAVRVWAAGHLFKTQRLITSGPYRFTRNPLYLGRFLILTGIAVMAWFSWTINMTVLLATWALFFSYYMPRKERIEPQRLERIHGSAYRAYRDAVPALFPRRAPWPDDGERWQRQRFARNREHLMLAALVVVLALCAGKAWGVI